MTGPCFSAECSLCWRKGNACAMAPCRQFLHEAAQALESRSSEVAVVKVVLQPQQTEHVDLDNAAPKRQRLEECLSEKSVEETGAREPSDFGASNEGATDDVPQMQMFHATAST